MSVVEGIVVFAISWWMVLFMVLPFGNRPPEDPELGHAPSAPEKPRLLLKAAITTVIAIVVTVGIYAVVESNLFSFRTTPG